MSSDPTQRAEKMLAELNALHAKATPGEWLHIVGYGLGSTAGQSITLGANPLDHDGPANSDQRCTMSLHNNFPALTALAEEALAARAYMDGLGAAMANAAANIPATDEWQRIKQTLANARAKTDKALEAL